VVIGLIQANVGLKMHGIVVLAYLDDNCWLEDYNNKHKKKKIVKKLIESSIERYFFGNFTGIFASILEILTKLIKYLGLSNRTNDEKFFSNLVANRVSNEKLVVKFDFLV